MLQYELIAFLVLDVAANHKMVLNTVIMTHFLLAGGRDSDLDQHQTNNS